MRSPGKFLPAVLLVLLGCSELIGSDPAIVGTYTLVGAQGRPLPSLFEMTNNGADRSLQDSVMVTGGTVKFNRDGTLFLTTTFSIEYPSGPFLRTDSLFTTYRRKSGTNSYSFVGDPPFFGEATLSGRELTLEHNVSIPPDYYSRNIYGGYIQLRFVRQ